MLVRGTAGVAEVRDEDEWDLHRRRQDRIVTMETVVVILSVVAGVVGLTVGAF